jgi:hypothetical protein
MATIDEIIAAVEAVPVTGDGSLTLSAGDFAGIAVMQAFFTAVVGAPSYTLAGAARTPGSGTITVRGQAEVLGYPGATAAIVFTTTEGPGGDGLGDDGPGGAAPPLGQGVAVSLTGTLSPQTPRSLPAVPWISVAGVSVAATVAEPFNAVTYGFSASIVLPGEPAGTIPIIVAQVDGGLWMVAVAGQGGQSVTAEQLVALLGGQELESFLPAELTAILEGLALSDLAITFDPGAKTVASVSAGLTVTNGWTPAPGLELEPGLHLALSVQNPADETARVFTAVVTGTFKIDGTEVPVFVQVDVAGGTSRWLTGLNPASDGVTLPSLSGLFTMAGGAAFTQSLPAALAQLPGIQISQLLIGFTLSPAALQSVNFAATTTEPWPIIDGFLTLEQLTFGLTLGALDTAAKTVGGSLTAILDITPDVGLYFSCAKDPASGTWTFSGGLPPGRSLNLTDLVAKLLSSFVTIPPAAPALVLDTVDLTVVAGASMTFRAGSVTPWPLLPGLVLDSFLLTFAYTSGAKDPFTGSLATTMTVAQVPLAISVGLDTSGVWSLAGHTAPGVPVDVTRLVNDLDGTFGVPAVPADALGGLTISDLSVSFSAGAAAGSPAAFHFGCTGTFDVADTELDITVAIDLSKAQDHYTGTFTGQLAIKKADATTEQIQVTFAGGKLTATWAASPGHGLSLTDLASCLGFTDMPDIPQGLNLTLTGMSFSYDVPSASLSVGATTASGDKAVFVTAPVGPSGNQARRFAFAVDLPLNVTLADLPLVGDKLPDADQLGIPDLGCWFLSGDLAGSGPDSGAATLNAQVPAGYPRLPETPLAAGLLLSGTLRLGSENVPLGLAAATPAQPAARNALTAGAGPLAPAASSAAAPAAAGGATTKWFTIQRSFGVFTLSRLGIQYADSTLYFLLDASIGLGPLELTTQGLGIGSPLTSFEPTFHLDGLGLAYDQPPLEIAGGFLAIPSQQLSPDVAYQYDGFAVVKAESFALAAIGSYAQLRAGDPSLFVFAQLDAPLGGPPALFVTGLMAGFGYNRTIALPAQDQVLGFPLLALAAPPSPGQTAPPQAMGDVLAILEGTKPITPGGLQQQWIAPKTGEYWLAVGLQFTSFELVTTQALLIAQFGQDLAFALLGLSTLRLPQGAPDAETYAYVELELEAVLKPSEGVFGLTAVLGPASYVIAPACHLTGGFAFFVWFGDNPNAGQFVVTLGGYHPAFNVPSYFPAEPRLGFSWAVSDQVAVKGQAYFALTTSCVMAGGGLEITFQSGNLRAWFTAQMDVLISWRPFFFLAGIGVSIGVAYKLDLGFVSKTITVSIGASVSLWGPPTGGTVTVNLWVVSFTVDFGEPQGTAANDPLDPAGFAALLPPVKTLVTVTASSGLTRTLDGGTWVVRASSFAFVTGSAIPATALAHGGPGGADTTQPTGFALRVRPMNLAQTQATHTVHVTRPDGSGGVDLTGWAPAPVTRAVPESLWGAPLTDAQGRFTQLPQQASNATVGGAPVGATFTCPPPALGPTPGAVPETVLAFEPVSPPDQPAVDPRSPLTVGAVPSSAGLPAAGQDTLAVVEQVAGTAASAARAPVLAALAADAGGAPLYGGPVSSLSGLAGMVNDSFSAQPLIVGASA